MQSPAAGGVDERLAQQIERIIVTRVENDTLTLPAMPAVAAKVLTLLHSSDFSMREIAALIETDPMVAAQVIKSANSAALATREPTRNIGQAVARLGAQKLRGVLIEVSSRRLFESRDKRILDAARRLWEHSRAVAVLAQDVSVVVGIEEPEVAYLGGLLHDVGKPIVATMLLEAESQIAQRAALGGWIDSEVWTSVVQRTHRRVGLVVARKWQLPDDVVAAIEQCDEYDAGSRRSCGNAVRFANAIAKREGFYVGSVQAEDNDALIMLGKSLLGVTDEVLGRVIAGLRSRAKDLMS